MRLTSFLSVEFAGLPIKSLNRYSSKSKKSRNQTLGSGPYDSVIKFSPVIQEGRCHNYHLAPGLDFVEVTRTYLFRLGLFHSYSENQALQGPIRYYLGRRRRFVISRVK